MAARFRLWANVGGGGGSGLATQFEDDFLRADTAAGLGAQYIGMPRSSLQSSQAMPMCRIVSNQMVQYVVGAAPGSQVPGVMFLPVPILNEAVYGMPQFAELTFVSQVGDTDMGPAVLCTGDFASQNQTGYQIEVDAPNMVLNLLTSVRTQLATAAYAPLGGDVWRIEATPGVAANALVVKINGAIVISIVDSTAGCPIQTGYPSIWNFASAVGSLGTFGRFAAGVL